MHNLLQQYQYFFDSLKGAAVSALLLVAIKISVQFLCGPCFKLARALIEDPAPVQVKNEEISEEIPEDKNAEKEISIF